MIDVDVRPNPGAYITVSFDTQPIPEPGTWVLIGLGLGVLGVLRRRVS